MFSISIVNNQEYGTVYLSIIAKYYERFFELVKKETTSVNKGHNLNFDTRITTGEKEVSKRRADIFFRLKQGEFIAFADGKDKRIQFRLLKIKKYYKKKQLQKYTNTELKMNLKIVYRDIANMA